MPCKTGFVRRKAYSYKRNGKTIHVKATCIKRAASKSPSRKPRKPVRKTTKVTKTGVKRTGKRYCSSTGKRYALYESKASGALFYIKDGKRVYPKSSTLLYGIC